MKLAPNIRVNAISPGPTLKNKRQSESHFKKQWKSILLKKQVDVENISETVKFLIKNDNITGEIINVDSGQRLAWVTPVSYTHLRAHETKANLVCRLLLEKKKRGILLAAPID